MKIKFLKPEKSRFGEWQPGDVEDVDDTEAARLIAAQIAEAHPPLDGLEREKAKGPVDLSPRGNRDGYAGAEGRKRSEISGRGSAVDPVT